MYVKDINEVKNHLETLKNSGFIKDWALPYENLLTRLSAAIFFVTPSGDDEGTRSKIWEEMGRYENFSYRVNHEKKLSGLPYRITFSKEEKEKNMQAETV